jgi:hypothetical protein
MTVMPLELPTALAAPQGLIVPLTPLTENSYRCSQPHNTIHNILQPLTSASNLFIR